jgi:SAM-dependent methyltransferase
MAETKLQRRVAGHHDIRMDGMIDLVMRARGAAVMDIGCNRGLVGFEFANNGAALVHGCDNYEAGIRTAREVFIDLRAVESRFEVVDLLGGPAALAPFGDQRYDIMLLLATYHKLKRVMSADKLSELMMHLAGRTSRWFAWRGTSDKPKENEQEMAALDRDLGECRFRRVQTSTISDLGLAAIWARQ